MSTRPDPKSPASRGVTRTSSRRELLTLVAGVLIGLVVFEWVLGGRTGPGLDSQGALLPHPTLGWENRPGFRVPERGTQLDRFGLRNPPTPDPLPADEFRVAVFGASRVYGAGVPRQDDLWNYRLQSGLAERLSQPVRVWNGGVNGYSALQAARRAHLLLSSLRPDWLVVVVSPRSQLMLDGSQAQGWKRVGPGENELIPRDLAARLPDALEPFGARGHHWLARHSVLYRRHRALEVVRGVRGADYEQWLFTGGDEAPEVAESLERTFAEFAALSRACDALDVQLRVFVLAEIAQDSEDGWQRYLEEHHAHGAPAPGTDRRAPNRALGAAFDELGIRVWDGFDLNESMGRARERYLLPQDYHWSRDGHEAFARELLARMLADDGWTFESAPRPGERAER